LNHNFRTKSNDPNTKLLAQSLKNLRLGNVSDPRDIALINSKLIILSKNDELAHETVSPTALWLAPSKAIVRQKNQQGFDKLVETGAEYYRCVAAHVPVKELHARPDTNTRHLLLKHYGNKYDSQLPPFIDLAIGSRVRCTHNLATQLGKKFKT
jgi:hypothetical protein